MSAWNTLLTVTNIGVSAANYSKLQELQQQQDQAQAVTMLVQLAKDMLFSFKQAADDILANEAINPKLSAAKLQILNRGLTEVGITPQMFPDLADKEYAATTLKYVTTNCEHLMSKLSIEDKQDVNEVIQAIQDHQDAEYYVEHYDSMESYRQAKPIYDELSKRNGCLMTIGIILLFYPGVGIPTGLLGMIGGAIGSLVSSDFELGLGILGIILGFVIWLGTVIWIFRWKRGKEFKEAKKSIEAIDSAEEIIENYHAVENRLKPLGKGYAQELRSISGEKIEQFFGTKVTNFLPG